MTAEKVRLEDVLITEQLYQRQGQCIDPGKQSDAYFTLAHEMSYGTGAILHTLCHLAIDLCGAGTSGVSVLKSNDDGEYFSWDAMVGKLSRCEGGTSPRNHSPGGVCMARNAPQLFSFPEKYFTWLKTTVPIVEGLVMPLYGEKNEAIGAIWVLTHDERHRFNTEHLRIMTELGAYTSRALRLQTSLDHHVR